ncbi:MAG: hypothetical protein V1809_05995 [Planctomycetota bacterium]
MKTKEQCAQEIMQEIHDILWNDWDPIGVKGLGPEDEYDSYIGGVYRLLASKAPKETLSAHLQKIETDSMGLSPARQEVVNKVVDKLSKLDVSIENRMASNKGMNGTR